MNQALFNLIAGTTGGFFVASFLYLCVDDLKLIFGVVPILAFCLTLHKYVEHNKYIKKKDTFEYISNFYIKKLRTVTKRMNARYKSFENYFHLSVDEKFEHKGDVEFLHIILTDLNEKIEHNVFDKDVLSTYFNETFKDSLLNILIQFTVAFINRPSVVLSLYKNLFDDYDLFIEKVEAQHKYISEYFNEKVSNDILIDIDNEKKNYREWGAYTTTTVIDFIITKKASASEIEILLNQLTTLKNLFSNQAVFYLNLGNLYSGFYSDFYRADKYLRKAIEIDSNCFQAYVTLASITYDKSKNLDSAIEILNQVPKEYANEDQVLTVRHYILNKSSSQIS